MIELIFFIILNNYVTWTWWLALDWAYYYTEKCISEWSNSEWIGTWWSI